MYDLKKLKKYNLEEGILESDAWVKENNMVIGKPYVLSENL